MAVVVVVDDDPVGVAVAVVDLRRCDRLAPTVMPHRIVVYAIVDHTYRQLSPFVYCAMWPLRLRPPLPLLPLTKLADTWPTPMARATMAV